MNAFHVGFGSLLMQHVCSPFAMLSAKRGITFAYVDSACFQSSCVVNTADCSCELQAHRMFLKYWDRLEMVDFQSGDFCNVNHFWGISVHRSSSLIMPTCRPFVTQRSWPNCAGAQTSMSAGWWRIPWPFQSPGLHVASWWPPVFKLAWCSCRPVKMQWPLGVGISDAKTFRTTTGIILKYVECPRVVAWLVILHLSTWKFWPSTKGFPLRFRMSNT